jgi:preprotein translocase subunit Sec63
MENAESKLIRSNGLMKLEDAAKILGLQVDSSLEQIKAAYKNLAVSVYPTNVVNIIL